MADVSIGVGAIVGVNSNERVINHVIVVLGVGEVVVTSVGVGVRVSARVNASASVGARVGVGERAHVSASVCVWVGVGEVVGKCRSKCMRK